MHTAMCQLLGMNCNVPTDICFSFQGFAARGGKTDEHRDGWGIAFFEGRGCRLFVDQQPAVSSPIAALVQAYPIRSTHVIAHIRKATQGSISLENCHPFRRPLWGRYWVFAHNGNLENCPLQPDQLFQPVGDTDSEAAFCLIISHLQRQFPTHKPGLGELQQALGEVTATLAPYGTFNYLLSDGDDFFAYCSTYLCYIVRQAPFRAAHLIDADLTVDFRELTQPQDRVAVIATTPLTDDEVWVKLTPGQLVAFREGYPQAWLDVSAHPPLQVERVSEPD